MTWDQLIGKIREGLDESGARLRVLGNLLAKVNNDDHILRWDEIGFTLTSLTLAVSDLHSTIEHLAIGLAAVGGAYREAPESQEVKGG